MLIMQQPSRPDVCFILICMIMKGSKRLNFSWSLSRHTGFVGVNVLCQVAFGSSTNNFPRFFPSLGSLSFHVSRDSGEIPLDKPVCCGYRGGHRMLLLSRDAPAERRDKVLGEVRDGGKKEHRRSSYRRSSGPSLWGRLRSVEALCVCVCVVTTHQPLCHGHFRCTSVRAASRPSPGHLGLSPPRPSYEPDTPGVCHFTGRGVLDHSRERGLSSELLIREWTAKRDDCINSSSDLKRVLPETAHMGIVNCRSVCNP